jgi:hypothetical protein
VSSRAGFDHLSTHHQFAALLDAVAVDHSARAAALCESSHATQLAILSALADAATAHTVVSETELWRVRRPNRSLSCLAVRLPIGMDLRLMEGDDFRRTVWCQNPHDLRERADEWKAKLLGAGWSAE